MSKPRTLLLAGAAGLAVVALLAARSASAASLAELPRVEDPGAPTHAEPYTWALGPDLDMWADIGANFEAGRVEQDMQSNNVRAFLALIAWAEGTDREPEPYRVCYGYRHTIRDLAQHPALSGEWRGEKLSDAMCKGAGLGPGCVSTAAGRYQIIRRTWQNCQRAMNLQDFGPDSQDAAAIYLLRQRGALELIERGDIRGAIVKARPEWASLPGNAAGQPQRRADDLLAVYSRSGGVFG